MDTSFIDIEDKPERWPANAREQQLERVFNAVEEFRKNPSYKTKEVVLALVNSHDYNQFSQLGLVRITDYEVSMINTLYLWGMFCCINSLKTFLYELISDATAMHKMCSWVDASINKASSIRIEQYEEGLFPSLKLYHFAFQKYNVEKDKSFAEQIIAVVEECIVDSNCSEKVYPIAHAFTTMLNDLSYMKGNKKTSFWKFNREELKRLFQLEVRLMDLSNQNPYKPPLRGVLMTQISNFILKSRNNYNDDYLCKYVSEQVASNSIRNHQLWMRKTSELNDEREEKVIPELFEDSSWIKYSWIKNIDFTETRTYYVSSFCKELNNDDMKRDYGNCIYGYKNDRIAELIAPIMLSGKKRLFLGEKEELQEIEDWPTLSQVIAFDVLYDKDLAKEELSFLFDIIDLLKISEEEKKDFLQIILQYWVLSVKDPKWAPERERRYVIFLYDAYNYIEMKEEDSFLKVSTSLFALPDFILGGPNPARFFIKPAIENKLQYIADKSFMFCNNCYNVDYDVVNGLGKVVKCPICSSEDIVINEL